jgi:hypothetical protein
MIMSYQRWSDIGVTLADSYKHTAPWARSPCGVLSPCKEVGKYYVMKTGHYATNRKVVLGPGVYSASNRNEYQKH